MRNGPDSTGEARSSTRYAPGGSPVYLHLLFPKEREVILLSEERLQVTPSEALVQHIETLFGEEVVHFE